MIKRILFYLIAIVILGSCEEKPLTTNTFVVDNIKSKYGISEYTIKKPGSLVRVRDSVGKFNTGDTLIFVKKSDWLRLIKNLQPADTIRPNILKKN